MNRPFTTLLAAIVTASGAGCSISSIDPPSPHDTANMPLRGPLPKQDCAPRDPTLEITREEGGHPGTDWPNQMAAWTRSHAYYPPQAADNHEEGEVTVQVVVDPNGQVTSVEMRSPSGSKWLNIAAMAMFRDATIPLPPDTTEPFILNYTMRYKMPITACPGSGAAAASLGWRATRERRA